MGTKDPKQWGGPWPPTMPYPEAVCLLTVQRGVEVHPSSELVDGEDISGLFIHTGPLDTVNDTAKLLFIRLDLWGRSGAQ